MYKFLTRDALEKFLQEEVCTSAEAQEILGITRQGVFGLVERGKLVPIFSRGQVTIFWRADVMQRKKAREE